MDEFGEIPILFPGDFIMDSQGHWHGCSPNGHMCNLTNHRVDEHEDGTITVSPSIKISVSHNEVWHGFLQHGIWRECGQ